MSETEKEILLRDLCMRLPYGVVMATGYGKGLLTSIRVNDSNEKLGINVDPVLTRLFNVNEVKPYLFPLSSMTEEQEIEYDATFETIVYEDGSKDSAMTYRTFDYLNKNKFDYRGLIPKGLAEDATGKNIY